MDLSGNWYLNGILLSQWGTPGAFPMLQVSMLAICLQLILLEGLLEATRFNQIDSMRSKSVFGAYFEANDHDTQESRQGD